jgi:predicted HicB family RNase H-like nuclease
MSEGRRARGDQRAQRVNAAAEALASGEDMAGAVRSLARRFALSERQARRYVERARAEGVVAVPQPSVVFTVRVPEAVVNRLRGHARASGRTLSSLVAQAVSEFLDRMGAGPRGGRPAR